MITPLAGTVRSGQVAVETVQSINHQHIVELTLTGWSCSTPGPIILTSSETPSSESVAIVASEGSNGSNRSAVNKSITVGNASIR